MRSVLSSSLDLTRSAMIDFSTRVKAALEDKTEKVVLIKGDKDAKYSAIMEAMDSLRAVGIEDIGLITEPRKDPNAPAAGGK